MGKRKRNEGREVKDIHPEDWLESYSKVSRWLAKYDLVQQLEENGGLVKIPNFLPSNVAELALEIVEAIPADHWLDTAADRDYTQNNISHSFSSTKRGSEKLQSLLRLFILLLPDQLNAFSAARYGAKDHIEPHDDRAYVPVQLEERGEVITCSRDIAVIYYLTKDWSRDMGGVLVDCQTGEWNKEGNGAHIEIQGPLKERMAILKPKNRSKT